MSRFTWWRRRLVYAAVLIFGLLFCAWRAIFPNQRLIIAILANLGHAKFPFARLMGVVNPYLN
jgi:hypothetical protein